jgi:N-acetylglucosaminyl-diphospho-decaprenol L-rhamnosyltransferase
MSDLAGASCSVIVVNFNGGTFVAECLRSLAGQVAPGIEIETIVVDNASTDGSDSSIEAEFPEVRLIRSARNLGFGGGVNLALAETSSDLVILINNDAVAEPGFIAAVTSPFASGSARLAAVTAQIILSGTFRPARPGIDAESLTYVAADGARWVRAAPGEAEGITLMNSTGNQVSRTGNGRDRSWLAPASADRSSASVFGFCGGGAALRREALEAVGGFDQRLFMYYEDTDLSWRLRRGGWQINYAPLAVVRHRHAASSGIRSRFFLTHNIRNRILVSARNGPPEMFRAALVRTVGSLVKALGRGFSPRGGSDARLQAAAGVTALLQSALMLPAYLREGRVHDAAAQLPRDFIWDWAVEDKAS